MEPLTIDQLKDLGFIIERKPYRKRAGEEYVFDSCYLDHKHCSYEEQELMGAFYSPPTILQIVNQVAKNAAEKERQRIKEKLANQFLD